MISNNQLLLKFEQKMIDFSRTFCDLHPNELISNFCSKEECNIGLCATCICSHTDSHMQKKTAPEYQNIRATYSKMQQCIRTRISAYEQEKSRINLLIEVIQGKRKNVLDSISQARHQTLDFVNRFFDTKEKELLRKMQADEKKVGLHNQNRLDSLLNLISRDITSLFQSAQDLNSQNFLQSFHRIRTQVLSNSLQTQREISEELQKNQNYEASVSINPIFINEVKIALEKSMSIAFGQKQTQQKIIDLKESNRNSRLVININENSNATVMPRKNESMPKANLSTTSTARFSPQIINPYVTFYTKPSQAIQMHQVRRPAESVSYHNGMLINQNTSNFMHNYGSRVELSRNNSEKTIKQNAILKQPLPQPMVQGTSTPISQLQSTKKIRRSGLTILKAVDNQIKGQP